MDTGATSWGISDTIDELESLDADLSLDEDFSLDAELDLDLDGSEETDHVDLDASEQDLSLDTLADEPVPDELESVSGFDLSEDVELQSDSDEELISLDGGDDAVSDVIDDLSDDLSLDLSELDETVLDMSSESVDSNTDALDLNDVDEVLDFDLTVDSEEAASLEADADVDALADSFDLDVAVEDDETVQAATETSTLSALEGDDLAFLTDADEVSTKLDLARAYVDMGDEDGARDILMEVLKEGTDEQKAEANALVDGLS